MVPLLLVDLQLLDLLLESSVLFLDRVSYDLSHHFLIGFELFGVWYGRVTCLLLIHVSP